MSSPTYLKQPLFFFVAHLPGASTLAGGWGNDPRWPPFFDFLQYQRFTSWKTNMTMEHLGVSKNNGTPKSSSLIGFSIINHPFGGTPIFGNTRLDHFRRCFFPIPNQKMVTFPLPCYVYWRVISSAVGCFLRVKRC